ncbi:hypothetical protein RHMOL_Rhmol05G0241700 [Rhododendron molle]|uniref:Uncharacterized protein n=1 Tax=Rhododendron molle TaxID=49168 RepID=A0ACC0NTP9_RHOML|nr:hypothetical protein RHMOL_Rhmol05G0241700 [Rhododendron molle]
MCMHKQKNWKFAKAYLSLEFYSNETLPATQLLKLMDAGMSTKASRKVDKNVKFSNQPSFPHISHRSGIFPLSGGLRRDSSADHRGGNFTSVPISDAFLSQVRGIRIVSEEARFLGQIASYIGLEMEVEEERVLSHRQFEGGVSSSIELNDDVFQERVPRDQQVTTRRMSVVRIPNPRIPVLDPRSSFGSGMEEKNKSPLGIRSGMEKRAPLVHLLFSERPFSVQFLFYCISPEASTKGLVACSGLSRIRFPTYTKFSRSKQTIKGGYNLAALVTRTSSSIKL